MAAHEAEGSLHVRGPGGVFVVAPGQWQYIEPVAKEEAKPQVATASRNSVKKGKSSAN